jgi:hypothetical protein
MPTQVTAWRDSRGEFHLTENDAHKAELVVDLAALWPGAPGAERIAEQLVDRLKDIKPIIQASPYVP